MGFLRGSRRARTHSHISAPSFFELAYGRAPNSDERALLDRLVPDVSNASNARAILRAFDQQFHPTRFAIKFSEDDLELVDLQRFSLWTDRRDPAVSAVIADRHEWEPHITATLEALLKEGHTFVDVGANIGFHTFLASHLVGPSGHVIAIEADSENCRLLWLSRSENEANNVEVVPTAVDAERGIQVLSSHLGSNGGLVGAGPGDLRDGTGVVVHTARLDDIITGRVDVMKIDIEGAEFRALAGSTSLLRTHRPAIVMELSAEMSRRVSQVEPEAALQAILDIGYHLAIIDRDTGARLQIASARELFADWADPFRIEDILLTPRQTPTS